MLHPGLSLAQIKLLTKLPVLPMIPSLDFLQLALEVEKVIGADPPVVVFFSLCDGLAH